MAENAIVQSCLWCGEPFTPRATGGKPQRFCRPRCRRAFDAAGRRYVEAALADGALTVFDLREGPSTTRALHGAHKIPSEVSLPVSEALESVSGALSAAGYNGTVDAAPASVAPAESLGEAAELLDELLSALLELPGDGWFKVADMLPAGLVDKLCGRIEAGTG